ncbi:MAG: type II toxin-antitoxin system RelE/ParE family toxin [Candidatus Methanomethylophilaceae archaeon]|nr:type II toxin-antitoxin system RelE/ParE family toxin [Candidatus Methanomethylophilaceae archaeon]
MSDYRVELSGEAQDQITGIYGYIKNDLCNPSAAESFLDDTEDAVGSLERFPYAHMVRPGSKSVGGYEKRQFFYRENYCLFYVIKEESKIVRVIRVAYSRMDLDRD